MGFDGVEVPIGAVNDVQLYTELGRGLEELGLARTTIVSCDEATNPLSPDPQVRNAAVERLRRAVGCAAAVGSPMLGGPFYCAYKTFTGEPASDEERAWAAEVLRAAAEEAELAGITLAIEALNRFECYLVNTMDDAIALVGAVDHPALGVHYDTHHMHVEEKSQGEAIRKTGERIRHVHASENDRGVPGQGQVDWRGSLGALREIGYDDWLTIEAFSRNEAKFANAIHVWRDYGAAPLEVAREGLAFLRGAWEETGSD
jgi:D-psicose/D-tagatose/L-ribulose 3-epimerase